MIILKKSLMLSTYCHAISYVTASFALYPPCIVFAPMLFSFLYSLPRLIFLFNPFAVCYFTV